MTEQVRERAAEPAAGERPRRRVKWIVLAALTAAAVVVPSGVTAARVVLNRTAKDSTGFTAAVREVRIDVGEAEVRLGRGEPGRARLEERLSWAFSKPKVRKYVQDGVLWVMVRCDDAAQAVVELECGAEVDITVPPEAKVTATSTSGSLEVRGLEGGVELRSHSGMLSLFDTRGPVLFEANSGALHAERLDAPKLTSKVGSGSVEVQFATPPVDVLARAGSGAIEMAFPRDSHYRVSGASNSGSRDVDPDLQDRSAPGRIDVSTGAGSVTLGYSRR